ncbi:MAG: sulfite exporter TauE/SafE family protein [Anaerolineales bacterium]
MEGFLLGLASGGTCLAYCAPVLVPMLLGAGQSARGNGILLGKFLIGRLGGYLLFGFLAWWTGQRILDDPILRSVMFGAAYLVLAVMLLYFGLAKLPPSCALGIAGPRKWLARRPALLPLGMGFVTGLNLCPPFLLAFAGAAYAGSLAASLMLFAAFFVGTSIFMLPLPFLGAFHRHAAVALVGKMAAVLMAAYYLYSGVITLLGGFA